ncbi:MAG: alginate lyase family protein [Terrimicrobiaceae bacterium]
MHRSSRFLSLPACLFLGAGLLAAQTPPPAPATPPAPKPETYIHLHFGRLPKIAPNPPDEKLPHAVLRAGAAAQPFRASVGGREYDFAQLLRLRPADTDGKDVKILTPFKFTHPGLLNDLRELEFIKKKIAAGEQPWAGEFEKLKKHRFASLDYVAKMKPVPEVISCDFSGANNKGSLEEQRDGNAAVTQALLWYFTGDEAYAKNAAQILDTYAATVTSHEGKNWYLEAAWVGSVFPVAADLLRSTYPAWQGAPRVAKWFNDVLLPPLHSRAAYGNRESAGLNALAAIGVFNEDTAALYTALQRWMNFVPAYHYLAEEDGPIPHLPDYWTPDVAPSEEFLLKLNAGTQPKDWTPWIQIAAEKWNINMRRGKFGDDITAMRKATLEERNPAAAWRGAPATYLSGYTAETARDLAHVDAGFNSEINTAEIAWHQGIDVYTPMQKRLTLFMETHLGLRLGIKPPPPLTLEPSWEAMRKLRAGEKLENAVEIRLIPYGISATWEIAYNHYANRQGIPLPNTRRVIDCIRLTGPNGYKVPKGTEPNADGLWEFPAPIPPLFATVISESAGWTALWEAFTHGELDADGESGKRK